MADLSVRMAQDDQDVGIVRALCREWLDWHWRVYPDDWPPTGADHPMDPDRFEAILGDLPTLHRRPDGAMFIGSVDGRDAGCVMYHPAGDGAAEFKRMFVSERDRGHGLGRRMIDAMVEQMRADGYRKAVFSSATFLVHARALYESVGFSAAPQPPGLPETWRDRVYFMERALA